MRLLIITQKVDRDDPILGFFHRWIEEFAKHCEQVTVVGQSVGDHQLPANVTVVSLEKEKGASRIGQVFRFWKLQKSLCMEYDTVFVHMTPIWVVLGFLRWRRVPVYLWYEARGGGWPLRVALRIVRKVFSASAHGMPVATRKSVITGHGIDTETYKPGNGPRDPHLVLTVGRITKSKNIDLLLRVFAALPHHLHFSIVGAPITHGDLRLLDTLRGVAEELKVSSRVEFRPLPPAQVVPLLQTAELFVHASETSLDKALLEAMACGCLTISTAIPASSVLPPSLIASPMNFARVAGEALALPEARKEDLRHELRETVVREHSLSALIERLYGEMGGNRN